MEGLTVKQVITNLRSIKKNDRSFTQEQIDSLNVVCNILESNFSPEDIANNLVNWNYWR